MAIERCASPRRGRRIKSTGAVLKKITASEEKRGFIYLPKPLHRGLTPRFVQVTCTWKRKGSQATVRFRGKLDTRFRLSIGQQYMKLCGLSRDKKVLIKWLSPDELEITKVEEGIQHKGWHTRDWIAEKLPDGRLKCLCGFIANNIYHLTSHVRFRHILKGETPEDYGKKITPTPIIEERPLYDHNKVRDIVRELGELRGFCAEVEYPMDGRRLDVIWKEVPEGSPLAVFEVHIRGNVFEALVKLRYARAVWPGTRIFLVTPKEDIEKARGEARRLPEIANVLRIASCDDIIELHELMRRVKELENRLGLS